MTAQQPIGNCGKGITTCVFGIGNSNCSSGRGNGDGYNIKCGTNIIMVLVTDDTGNCLLGTANGCEGEWYW